MSLNCLIEFLQDAVANCVQISGWREPTVVDEFRFEKSRVDAMLVELAALKTMEDQRPPTDTGNQKLLSMLIDIRDCLAGCDPQDHAVAFNALNLIIEQLQESLKHPNISRSDEIAFAQSISDLCYRDMDLSSIVDAVIKLSDKRIAQLREK
jgi:hypothetical protein